MTLEGPTDRPAIRRARLTQGCREYEEGELPQINEITSGTRPSSHTSIKRLSIGGLKAPQDLKPLSRPNRFVGVVGQKIDEMLKNAIFHIKMKNHRK